MSNDLEILCLNEELAVSLPERAVPPSEAPVSLQFYMQHTKEFSKLRMACEQPEDICSECSLIDYDCTKKVIIFDLDNTLIYTTQHSEIVIRPFAIELVLSLRCSYDIWLWTAAENAHVQYVFSKITIFRGLFSKILTREHCTILNDGIYLKSLGNFINLDKKNVLAIDDNMCSFAWDLPNYLYIDPYIGDTNDSELFEIKYLIDMLFAEEDVRVSLKKVCNFSAYLSINI